MAQRVQVVGRATRRLARLRCAPARPALFSVDACDRRGLRGFDVDRRAARVGEDAAERPHDVGVLARTERTGPITSGTVRVEHRDEPGDVALDHLFVDDVGLVDAALGPGAAVFSTFTDTAGRVRLWPDGVVQAR